MATLQQSLTYKPAELAFGTSGLRGLVTDMTDLECYINTLGFLQFLQQHESLPTDSVVYLGGDLRNSTPRILRAVHKAIADAGCQTIYVGLVPTPAIALYGMQQKAPSIMVTGSHIPEDRNGIKFYKVSGEVLKPDETAIKQAVAEVRARLYGAAIDETGFKADGSLAVATELPQEIPDAQDAYENRYATIFGDRLKGKKVVFYQHSAVGRDQLVSLLRRLGAEVVPVGRSDVFVPIDTENVTPADKAYFEQLAHEHPGAFAVVSTDGDGDRPFVIDEAGVFHRGDALGALVADWLKSDFAAYPVSASDAVDQHLDAENVPYVHTKIGSPYVIAAMNQAIAHGKKRVVGWEVNGGFLLGDSLYVYGKELAALPTRDAIFPIIVALVAAVEANKKVSQIFTTLEKRFTQAGLIDNFPVEISKKITAHFVASTPELRAELESYFTPAHGFGKIISVNTLDGVRITFENGDIAHLRPSGNAPQLRIYSVANSQERADEIVQLAIAEQGIFRAMQAQFA